MRKMGGIVLGMGVVILLLFVGLAVMSQSQPKDLGLKHGKLRPCSESPNCVCGEYPQDASHFVPPIQGDADTWLQLQAEIAAAGGLLETVKTDYVHATFRSALFRYVDDLECRWDADSGLIYLRSASRVGRSDFGVNRQRVENIRAALR